MTGGTAFDADAVIYAASADHPLGARVRQLFDQPDLERIGSVILLTEVLSKPMRDDPASLEVSALMSLVARLDLRPLDEAGGRLALALAIKYGLRAADSVHLATAIASGCTTFLTNNRKDFPRTITEIDVVYPGQL